MAVVDVWTEVASTGGVEAKIETLGERDTIPNWLRDVCREHVNPERE
jgi:hypothetical protein